LLYRFENFTLDLARQELRRNEERIEVEPQVLDLLHYLIRNRDRVVSKDDLIADVWRGRIVSDSTLTSRITAARQAIGDSGNRQRLIRTIPRKGVRFVGEASEDERPNVVISPAGVVVPRPSPMPSIAVLPFENMSAEPEQQFFADGIAEDIITDLSRYPWLMVIARNSSFTYRGRAVDVATVGRELGVRYVLEGSVRISVKRVRLTAQLIDAETGVHVWADRYDRDVADIFGVQDEITKATTTAIAPAVAHREQQRALRKPSLDAWTAYQQGLWHLAKGTEKDTARAETFFRRAIELDPLFAGGYIGRSAVLSRAKGTQADEEALARHAVNVDSGNAEAHARLALALLARGDHTGAREEATQALTACPNLAAAHGAFGVTLAYAGEPREGLAALERCLRLDPRGPFLVNRLTQVALAHYFARDYDGAVDAANRAIRAFPDFPSPHRWLAAALGQLDRVEEGRRAWEMARQISPAEWDFQVLNRPPWFTPERHVHMLDGLKKAGWSE
jgi:adenylate cyclase